MRAFRKAVMAGLVIAAGILAGCKSGNQTSYYPQESRQRQSVEIYDYANFLRAQNEGAYLDHLQRQDQMKSWDRTLDSLGRTGHRVTGNIGKVVESQKRRNR
jgi:hypothetical protein